MSSIHFEYLSGNVPTITLPNGRQVEVEDGHYRATTICSVKPGKNVSRWANSKAGEAFIAEMSQLLGKTLYFPRGRDGTWIHPVLLLSLAKYLGIYDHIEVQVKAAKPSRPRIIFRVKPKVRPTQDTVPEPPPAKKTKTRPKYPKPLKCKVSETVEDAVPVAVPEDEFTGLIVRSHDPQEEKPLDPFHEKLDITDFARWCIRQHGAPMDLSFVEWFLEHWHGMSWKGQQTFCCININELVTMGSYGTKADAKKNLLKRTEYILGKHYSISVSPRAEQDLNNKHQHGGHNEELILLTPDCFKGMAMSTRNATGVLTRTYFIMMDKVVVEYTKYEQSYREKREQHFSRGNSQAAIVIQELKAVIADRDLAIRNFEKHVTKLEKRMTKLDERDAERDENDREMRETIIHYREEMLRAQATLGKQRENAERLHHAACGKQELQEERLKAQEAIIKRHEAEGELYKMKMERMSERMEIMERRWPAPGHKD